MADIPIADITVRDETTSGKQTGEIVLSGIAATTTLRDLIRTRVREEVARFNGRKQELVFNGLVQPTETEAVVNGYRLRKKRMLDWEKQADVAVEALTKNRYFVLVDDRQITELDQELTLTPDTNIAFVRLVPLVGG